MKKKIQRAVIKGVEKVLNVIVPSNKLLFDRRDNLGYSCHLLESVAEMKIILFLNEGPKLKCELIQFCENLKMKKITATIVRMELNDFIKSVDLGTEGRKFEFSITVLGKSCLSIINSRIQWAIDDKVLEAAKKKLKLGLSVS